MSKKAMSYKAHQEVVSEYLELLRGKDEIIEKLKSKLNDIRVKVGKRIEYCAQQNGVPVCKNCGLEISDIKKLREQ